MPNKKPKKSTLSKELRLLMSVPIADRDRSRRNQRQQQQVTPAGEGALSQTAEGRRTAEGRNLNLNVEVTMEEDDTQDSDYDSGSESDTESVACPGSEDEEDDVPIINLIGRDLAAEDLIVEGSDDEVEVDDNDGAKVPFVSPPPPTPKGRYKFEAETPQNLVLPMDVMTYFIQEQMVCPNAECYSKDEGTAIEHPLRMEHCQYGFASEVYVRCPCCGWATAICPPKGQVKEDPTNGTPTKNKRDTESEQFHKYAINYNACLIMQKLGFGMRGLGLMMAMMGIQNSTGSNWKWNRLVDRVGLALNEVAEEVFIENQQKEKKATEDKAQEQLVEWLQTEEGIEATSNEATAEEATNNKRQQLLNIKDGKVGIAASNDTGWQKRRIGFNGGNSRTGHNYMCGGITCLPIGVKSFSQNCRMHEIAEKLGIQPKPHRCPRNFDVNMSSKAMEPEGAVQQVVAIWDSVVGIWVHTYISDDDSTTRANLQHSYHDVIAAQHPEIAVDGEIPSHLKRRYGWPVNDKNELLKDYGKLPYNVYPPQRFLADLQHRIRCFAKAIYELRCKGNPKTKPVDKLLKEECANIKKSFGAYCKKNQHWPLDKFCANVACVWLHSFNDHSLCDVSWCTSLKAELEEDEEKKKEIDDVRKYRSTDTTDEKKLLKKVEDKAAPTTTDEKMEEIWHKYNTQKNEALQKQASATLMKDKFWGGKNQIHDRLRLVAIIDTCGEYEGLSRIYNSLGLPPMHRVLGLWCVAKDKDDKRHHEHRKKIETKRKRSAKQIQNMKDGCRKEKRAKKVGMDYGTGVANDIAMATNNKQKEI